MLASGCQIREGRQLLGLSQADLAANADIALALILRAKASDGMPMLRRRDPKAIQGVLVAAGLEFTPKTAAGLRSGCERS